jgi:Divergent InlB B-repeat domain/PASTA domain
MARRAVPLLAAAALALAFALPAAASAAQTLTVQKLGAGEGTVASFPAGIDCGPSCSAPFADGATVSLIAAWGSPTLPVQWSGCDSVNFEGKCFVTMSSARTVTATFKLDGPLLTVAKGGAAAGTVTSSPHGIDCGGACSVNFTEGTTVTLTGTPDPHVKAVAWTGCDSIVSGKCVVAISAARAVSATFEYQAGYEPLPLTVAKIGGGQGTVVGSPAGIECGSSCEAGFEKSTRVELRAIPAPGSSFAGWSGACGGIAAVCRVKMNEGKEVFARFERLPPQDASLTLLLLGSGSGVLTCDGGPCAAAYPEGTTLSLAAIAVGGSSFAGFAGACSGPSPCALTLTADTTVSASFLAASAPSSARARCLVPKLRGKTLKAAKGALRHAHCALGKVSGPKRGGKALRVRSSSPAAGTALAAGAKVDLRLAAGAKHRRKR